MKTVVRLVSTFFYTGYVPRISGTAGSLAGLLFALMVNYNPVVYGLSLFVLTVSALFVIKRAEILFGKRDARKIVVDEAIGMMVALIFVPVKPLFIALAFVLFRIFDIFKPFPIKRVERIASPWGVVFDDILAGVYANILVQLAAIFTLMREV